MNGLGPQVLQDREVQGDWPALFGAESTNLRVVFLGRSDIPDDTAGVLELNAFPGGVSASWDSRAKFVAD